MHRYLRKDHPFGVPILTRRHDRFGPGHQRRLLSVLLDRCRLLQTLFSLCTSSRRRNVADDLISAIPFLPILYNLAETASSSSVLRDTLPKKTLSLYYALSFRPYASIYDTPERHAVATITVDLYDNLDRPRIFLVLSRTKQILNCENPTRNPIESVHVGKNIRLDLRVASHRSRQGNTGNVFNDRSTIFLDYSRQTAAFASL